MNEFELIQQLLETQNQSFGDDEIGPGDDAAVIAFPRYKKIIASKDLLVEGVHFDFDYSTPQDVGWKSLAVNASDIHAMGGALSGFLIGLALPPHMNKAGIPQKLYQGMNEFLRGTDAKIYGGDISRSRDLLISVTAIGTLKFPMKRSGAQIGDAIMVSGPLGYSQLGLDLLRESSVSSALQNTITNELKEEAVSRHRRPKSLAAFVEVIVEKIRIHSMIDVSDGFFQDAGHIAKSSNISCSIDIDKVPSVIPREVDPGYHFKLINGGEDYQLLFTVNEADAETIMKLHPTVSRVGSVRAPGEHAIYIVCQDEEYSLDEYKIRQGISANEGFDHFGES